MLGISTILKALQHRVVATSMELIRCCRGCAAAFIYEHVTRNVNSTDLTVNNVHKYARARESSTYLSRSIKFSLGPDAAAF